MKKIYSHLFVGISMLFNTVYGQTDYTGFIENPSFETGNGNGWTWTGTTGYSWIGPNNDGDATKDGTYINGLWNSTIGDAECSQSITGLPAGNYRVSAILSVSNNRLTNQRLFATSDDTTRAVLYSSISHPAYSESNMAILGADEIYSFGDKPESSVENGPFYEVSLLQRVWDGTLNIGIRVSGKATSMAYDFSYTPNNDAGFFKFDHFRILEVSNVATLSNISLSTGFLNAQFDSAVYNYNATLPQGTVKVVPIPIPFASGVTITGTDTVDVSSGSGKSTIHIVALDGVTERTYNINYKVLEPFTLEGTQQDRLYTNEFPLGDVQLLEGPFKHAMDLNIDHLLQYDVDKLLAPYRKEAGLPALASSYENWIGLDGHIGGHYLTAMAIHYAATGNITCKEKMDYMVGQLLECQDASAVNNSTWGVGYVGGVPSSSSIWPSFASGNISALNNAWVPWYNLHKTYAGLRDAWLYGNNETAKTVFLAFCDWAINITSGFSDAQMESMLNTEHGGMNEIFADAFQITGDPKYIDAAKRFSHKFILNSMASGVDNLDNQHANTQVPKAVGFQRIAEVSGHPQYVSGAEFFWNTVVHNRILAFGGNSRKEYFPPASAYMDFINDVEGPESCNTNNMLKLTENLFRFHADAEYVDFYERALYNHILSTQHPEHGGYVYFTPARPQHYRVYSAPNQAMWCCVGTGMENHGKYGEFIYTHDNDSLYLNLYIASELDWNSKGVVIRQETNFPEEEKTQVTITTGEPTSFTLMVRSPYWVSEGNLKIVVNGDTLSVESVPQTYIPVYRTWNNGDVVEIILPMRTTIEPLKNVPSYLAFMHGPILLGAKTGTENLTGLIADDSRWGHIASGPLISVLEAPIILGSQDSIPLMVEAIDGTPLNFRLTDAFADEIDEDLVLEPFYKIHDARYMMYWLNMSREEYEAVKDSLAEIEKAKLELEARTVDQVSPGQQQPEVDHNFTGVNSNTGIWQNEFWRDACGGGYFSYELTTENRTDLSLMVRYWGNESGNRTFDIFIDDDVLIRENVTGKWNVDNFINVEYPIPENMVAEKELVTVKFKAIDANNCAGGIFDLRMLKPVEQDTTTTDTITTSTINDLYSDDLVQVTTVDQIIKVKGLEVGAYVFVYDIAGRLVTREIARQDILFIPSPDRGLKLVMVAQNGETFVKKVIIQ